MYLEDLPKDVSSCFTNKVVKKEELFKEELLICKDYEQVRFIDFVRGRYCAHKCLSQITKAQAIEKDQNGAPIWPNGMTGSISHIKEYAGAIVAKKENYLSMGMDIEQIGRITSDLWPVIFTHNEMNYLRKFSYQSQKKVSTLFFSMKEAYYKMQYPLIKSEIENDDIEVVLSGNDVQFEIKNSNLVKLKPENSIAMYQIKPPLITSILLLKNGR